MEPIDVNQPKSTLRPPYLIASPWGCSLKSMLILVTVVCAGLGFYSFTHRPPPRYARIQRTEYEFPHGRVTYSLFTNNGYETYVDLLSTPGLDGVTIDLPGVPQRDRRYGNWRGEDPVVSAQFWELQKKAGLPLPPPTPELTPRMHENFARLTKLFSGESLQTLSLPHKDLPFMDKSTNRVVLRTLIYFDDARNEHQEYRPMEPEFYQNLQK